MSRRTKKDQIDLNTILKQFNHEIKGIFFIAIGLILLFALQSNSAGKVGEWLKYILTGLFSNSALILPYITIICGMLTFTNTYFWKNRKSTLFFSIVFLCILIIQAMNDIHFFTEAYANLNSEVLTASFLLGTEGFGGGFVGVLITFILVKLLGTAGAYISVTSLLLITLMLYTKLSLMAIIKYLHKVATRLFNAFRGSILELVVDTPNEKVKKTKNSNANNDIIIYNEDEKLNLNEDTNHVKDEKIKILEFTGTETAKQQEKIAVVEEVKKSANNSKTIDEEFTTLEVVGIQQHFEYIIPDIELLNQVDFQPGKDDKKKIIQKAKLLEDTLRNFGVEAKVIQVSKGPVITRYELQPSVGVKVSKIVNLSDDIALNLAAKAIRIEAPIPGKAAIGIEIPNEEIAMVTLREVIDSNNFKSSTANLPFALGKDISGAPVITDISKMPHTLIAGATGSGKSVCINSLLLSLLYSCSPDRVKLILVDPKVVELNQYNGIPHLLIPVVTDPKKATSALNWAVQEMTRRYKLFAENNVKDIGTYNERNEETKLPYIVIVIDELADLMMVAANEVEDAICRLAQMARAAGLHLILATQRPSVDVITGVIKANIPSRIAFSVASQTDSRTILDMGGAEKLLGKGDMLFYPMGANKPIRIQGAFVSEKEVDRVMTYIKGQVEKPQYETDIIKKIDQGEVLDISGGDDLFDRAVQMVIESQQASISMLQRRLRIGYNRAARLIDEMEAKGIIGPHEGSKPRQVLLDQSDLA